MPISALPGSGAIGDFGPAASEFVDFLVASGQSCWQVLPLGVTSAAAGNSPYSSISTSALDPLLISPDSLVAEGFLEVGEIPAATTGRRVRYAEARRVKSRLLALAWRRFRRDPARRRDLTRFREREAAWLEDYVLFRVLRRQAGGLPWTDWPGELRDREPAALRRVARDHAGALTRQAFGQYLAAHQWQRLRDRFAERRLEVVGDLPFYAAHDSVDVWSNPSLFALDEEGHPASVSGCPPDSFTAEGQLWGQPTYRWSAHREEGFAWWLDRIDRQLTLFDRLRLDHFRGLVATWNVPAGSATAMAGAWLEAPGSELVGMLRRRFTGARWVAEDLGVLVPEVHELRRALGAPATRVLQFGFGEDYPDSEHLPERVPGDAVLYSGTHDNDTLRGWLEGSATGAERQRLRGYLGGEATVTEAAAELLRRCLASPAEWVALPVQDLLLLGSGARLNRPGKARAQWTWRLATGGLTSAVAEVWRRRVATSGRLVDGDLG